MIVVVSLCLGILALAAVLALLRVVRPGTSLADRIIALDLILLIIVMGIAVATAAAASFGVYTAIQTMPIRQVEIGTVPVVVAVERIEPLPRQAVPARCAHRSAPASVPLPGFPVSDPPWR